MEKYPYVVRSLEIDTVQKKIHLDNLKSIPKVESGNTLVCPIVALVGILS